jgi:hypothetical protein
VRLSGILRRRAGLAAAARAVVVVMLRVIVAVVVMAMIMVMMVVMVVVVMVMVAMVIMAVVVMPVRGAGIGAAFGIERRLDRDRPQAEFRDQSLHLRAGLDPQPVRSDFHRLVAVAERPGETGELARIGADLEQRLRLRNHLDQVAILEHERVAHAKADR